ncbi:phenylacetate-CoA oxygenase/reductase, PaaK subunit [Klebsiella pneumoniae]|nr:phenylacetate-CoA oxygenase/reductase, PaaK subunit [Klebsiella pneumoniae]
MMAIMSATLATEPQSRFTLIYGNRSSHSMMFRQALGRFKRPLSAAPAGDTPV